jgi:uncharacterized protein YbbC (DUF1343 family)
MAMMAIFIIGADILLLWSLAVMSRFAIKYSNFNGMSSNSVFKNTVLFSVLLMVSCGSLTPNPSPKERGAETAYNKDIIIGADNYTAYLPLLKDKKVGIVTNQTGIIKVAGDSGGIKNDKGESIGEYEGAEHFQSVVDFLLGQKINLQKIFAPEHGFRGTADAGEHVVDGKDTKTGLPIISLYGDNKKPKPEQ